MRESTLQSVAPSMPTFATLEAWARSSIQDLLQRVLEEEVTAFLGRMRYQRRSAVDATPGSRNGHGKPRRVSLMSGTVQVRRPRVRGLEERFESRILPLFLRRTHEVTRMLPELYLHGLSQGDFELALRGLLGNGAPCRLRPLAACGRSGRRSWRPGESGVSTTANWCTRGRMADTSRPGWRRTRRLCWSSSAP